MLKNTAIHGKLKPGVKILLFGYATIVARIVGVDGPYTTLRRAIEQVVPPLPLSSPPRAARAAVDHRVSPLTFFSVAVGGFFPQLFGLRLGVGARLSSGPATGSSIRRIKAAIRAGAGPSTGCFGAAASGCGRRGAGCRCGSVRCPRRHARAAPPGHHRIACPVPRPVLRLPHRGNLPAHNWADAQELHQCAAVRVTGVNRLRRPRPAQLAYSCCPRAQR